MNTFEEHARVLLEQTLYDKRAALILLRKRTISRCSEEGVSVSETIDSAFGAAIAIEMVHARRTQEVLLEENKRLFWEKFGEFRRQPENEVTPK